MNLRSLIFLIVNITIKNFDSFSNRFSQGMSPDLELWKNNYGCFHGILLNREVIERYKIVRYN